MNMLTTTIFEWNPSLLLECVTSHTQHNLLPLKSTFNKRLQDVFLVIYQSKNWWIAEVWRMSICNELKCLRAAVLSFKTHSCLSMLSRISGPTVPDRSGPSRLHRASGWDPSGQYAAAAFTLQSHMWQSEQDEMSTGLWALNQRQSWTSRCPRWDRKDSNTSPSQEKCFMKQAGSGRRRWYAI